jgi:hypothetical protein
LHSRRTVTVLTVSNSCEWVAFEKSSFMSKCSDFAIVENLESWKLEQQENVQLSE